MSTKERGYRGAGRIYQRGEVWWIQYCFRGKVFRETSRSEDDRIARKLLIKRLGEIGAGIFKGPNVERTTFEDMATEIRNDYKINGRKSSSKVERALVHLRHSFELDRMIDITTDRIKAFIVKRQDEGAANATINRELATLKRMFSLGFQAGKVVSQPYIPMLKENNVRTGFFEWEDFVKLRKYLPEYLRPIVTFAYYTGWRRGEICSIQWRHVDINEGLVRLDPGTTKNNEGRIVYLPQEVRDLLSDLWEKRRLDCSLVFHREGERIGDFRKSWETGCKKAKLNGMLFHDFRRTAVRNLVRANVPERVAMQISGHKTRSIFDRYHIVSDSDLKEAALKVEIFSASQKESRGKVIAFQDSR